MLSKKTVLGNHISYSILDKTRGLVTPYEITKKLQISKQRVNYWLKKFKKEGWIECPFHGNYEITDSGKTVLETYEQQFNKDLVRLENMRYSYPIIDGLDSLIKKRRWDKEQSLKNGVVVYHTKDHDMHVRVIAGKNNPCLEITCKQLLGEDIYELMYQARELIDYVAEEFVKDYSLVLGKCKPVMQPEWAIPSEFAKVLLNKTNSSQITTPKGVINQSKGRGHDIETRDIRLANKIFNLPYVIDDIALQLKHLRVASYTGLFCF